MLSNINVTIFQPSKNAMQSGLAKTEKWKIRFNSDVTKYNYDLMSWNGSKDTKQQLNLTFSTKEQAIAFAKKNKWNFVVKEPQAKKVVKKSYSQNFK